MTALNTCHAVKPTYKPPQETKKGVPSIEICDEVIKKCAMKEVADEVTSYKIWNHRRKH